MATMRTWRRWFLYICLLAVLIPLLQLILYFPKYTPSTKAGSFDYVKGLLSNILTSNNSIAEGETLSLSIMGVRRKFRSSKHQNIRKFSKGNENKIYIKLVDGNDGVLNVSNKTRPLLKYHYMTIGTRGRLGNQLFQYAALLGAASRHGYTPFVTPRHEINKYLNIPYVKDVHMRNVDTFGEKKSGVYDKSIERLQTYKNWTLTGYYQSWKYFTHVNELVRNSVTFKDAYIKAPKDFVNALKAKNLTLIGVHIRRGDMNSKNAARKGYRMAGKDYILRAMEYFRRKMLNTVFVIISDDKAWCKKNVKGNDVVYSDFHYAGTDLALLSLCDHVIVTSGTFGWWGAWLAKGITTYYKGYPGPGTWLDLQYKREDYYPLHWIGL